MKLDIFMPQLDWYRERNDWNGRSASVVGGAGGTLDWFFMAGSSDPHDDNYESSYLSVTKM